MTVGKERMNDKELYCERVAESLVKDGYYSTKAEALIAVKGIVLKNLKEQNHEEE